MAAPQRIASLLASATEILYGLGLGDQVVGVSHECNFPTAARFKPCLTRSFVDGELDSLQIDQQVKDRVVSGLPLYEIDEQKLTDLAPELIVTQAQCDVCAIKYEDVLRLVQTRESLRQTQVVALSPNSVFDVFADIQRVGRATDRSAAADVYLGQLDQRVQHVRRATADLAATARPRVVCIEWLEPLMIAANWTPELVEIAGGQNGLSQAGKHSQYIHWDAIRAYDPEVLVLIPCGFDLPRTLREITALPNYPGWKDLSAVRQGRVFAIDGDAYFNRSGPRLVDSLEILAHLFFPKRCGVPATIPDTARVWSAISA